MPNCHWLGLLSTYISCTSVFHSTLSTVFNRSEWQEYTAAAAAKSLQSCPTLCDPIDGSPPGSPIPGILQAKTLEWVALPFFRGSSQPRGQTCVSCISRRFFTTAPLGKPAKQIKSPDNKTAPTISGINHKTDGALCKASRVMLDYSNSSTT